MMGGIAGRVDAMIGAVEAQKCTGCLHYHFFIFAQRAHQFTDLQEIGKRLEAGLLAADDLKNYLSNVCCESYPDVARAMDERSKVEHSFPSFAEKQECDSAPPYTWGNWKLGRVPQFVYDDAATYKPRTANATTTNTRSSP